MGKKVYIQLRDKSGSYHNSQQGLTISRSDVLCVEYDLNVQAGIANKLFVEISEAKAFEIGIKNLTDEEKEAAENEVRENLRLIFEKEEAKEAAAALEAEKEAAEAAALEAEKAAKEAAEEEEEAEKQNAAEKAGLEQKPPFTATMSFDEKAPAKGKGK